MDILDFKNCKYYNDGRCRLDGRPCTGYATCNHLRKDVMIAFEKKIFEMEIYDNQNNELVDSTMISNIEFRGDAPLGMRIYYIADDGTTVYTDDFDILEVRVHDYKIYPIRIPSK